MMRHALVFLLILCPALSAEAQDEIVQTEYTRLASIEKSSSGVFTRKKEKISFNLVELKNLTSGDVHYGVEVDLERRSKEKVGGSLALGLAGALLGGSTGAAISGGASVVYRNINEAGYIFLEPVEVDTLITFVNSIIATVNIEHGHFKVYKLSMGSSFEFGLAYDPAFTTFNREINPTLAKWTFLFSVDGVVYSLSYADGLEVLQRLSQFNDQMKDLMIHNN